MGFDLWPRNPVTELIHLRCHVLAYLWVSEIMPEFFLWIEHIQHLFLEIGPTWPQIGCWYNLHSGIPDFLHKVTDNFAVSVQNGYIHFTICKDYATKSCAGRISQGMAVCGGKWRASPLSSGSMGHTGPCGDVAIWLIGESTDLYYQFYRGLW